MEPLALGVPEGREEVLALQTYGVEEKGLTPVCTSQVSCFSRFSEYVCVSQVSCVSIPSALPPPIIEPSEHTVFAC